MFFLNFTPIPGEMIQFDLYVSDGLVQPPTCTGFFLLAVYGIGQGCTTTYENQDEKKNFPENPMGLSH